MNPVFSLELRVLEVALGELAVRSFVYLHYGVVNSDEVLSLLSVRTQAGYFSTYWGSFIPELPPGQHFSDKHLSDLFRSRYHKDLAVTLHFNNWVRQNGSNYDDSV